MFIGPKARTFNPEQIIGYGKADGLPRAEVDDSQLQLKVPLEKLKQEGTQRYRLGELIDHPALFQAYPELRRVKVKMLCAEGEGYRASNERHSGHINMAHDPKYVEKDSLLERIAHETQHTIQIIEGFGRGAGQKEFAVTAMVKINRGLEKRQKRYPHPARAQKINALSLAAHLIDQAETSHVREPRMLTAIDQLERRSRRIYFKVPGEIEAYAVEDRLQLTAAQRKTVALPAHLQSEPPSALVAAPQSPSDIPVSIPLQKAFARLRQHEERKEAVCKTFARLFGLKQAAATAPAKHNLAYKV